MRVGRFPCAERGAAFVYAFEHLEIGGYELLRRAADRTKDQQTAHLCGTALDELRTMADGLASTFDAAVDATFEALQPAGSQ